MVFYCDCADQMRQSKLMGTSNIWGKEWVTREYEKRVRRVYL
jgi:hypothetical protein